MRYCRKERQRSPSDIYYSEPISGGLCSGLIETLNAHRERDPRNIIGAYCVYRPAVVIRGIEENRRHEGDVIVIRPDSPLDHVLLSLTALARTAL